MSKTIFLLPPAFAALLWACGGDALDEDDLTGEWIQRDGARVCDGFMTRVGNEEYCVAEVPEGWQPFTFEGETYYRQPLDNQVTANESE